MLSSFLKDEKFPISPTSSTSISPSEALGNDQMEFFEDAMDHDIREDLVFGGEMVHRPQLTFSNYKVSKLNGIMKSDGKKKIMDRMDLLGQVDSVRKDKREERINPMETLWKRREEKLEDEKKMIKIKHPEGSNKKIGSRKRRQLHEKSRKGLRSDENILNVIFPRNEKTGNRLKMGYKNQMQPIDEENEVHMKIDNESHADVKNIQWDDKNRKSDHNDRSVNLLNRQMSFDSNITKDQELKHAIHHPFNSLDTLDPQNRDRGKVQDNPIELSNSTSLDKSKIHLYRDEFLSKASHFITRSPTTLNQSPSLTLNQSPLTLYHHLINLSSSMQELETISLEEQQVQEMSTLKASRIMDQLQPYIHTMHTMERKLW